MTIQKDAPRKKRYPLWVVEECQQRGWAPTINVGLTRAEAIRELRGLVEFEEPDPDRYRITKYFREASNG